MKPIIGLTMNIDNGRYVINEPYLEAIERLGGVPVCIPACSDEIVEMLDGLLLSGGVDIAPKYFGEEPHPKLGDVHDKRDELEMKLVERCLEKGVPIFGICRGLQLLNVYFGGTLYQHIEDFVETDILHQQKGDRTAATHEVKVEKGSQLFSIVESEQLAVNSMHHQGIHMLGEGLRASAVASDGLIEGIERVGDSFCVAVQWHPEELVKVGDESSLKLFQAFIERAREYKKKK